MRLQFLGSICFTLLLAMPVWAQAQTGDCSDLSPVALIVGEFGQVSPGQSNNVRDIPSRGGTLVGKLAGGEQFEVLDGPVCADGIVWWQIETDSVVGWTADGSDGEQWMFPMTEQTLAPEPPLVLSTTIITPENAAQLQPLRTVNCDTGPSYSSIALGSRYVAVNCGYYNINAPNATLLEQITNDRLGIIDLESGVQVMTLGREGVSVHPIAFLPDGRLLWYSQEDRRSVIILHLTDIETSEEIATTEIDDEQSGFGFFVDPIFYANDTRFARFYQDEGDYVLRWWDATTLTLLQEQVFEKPEAYVDGDIIYFAISPDGERFGIIYRARDEGSERSELVIYASTNQQPQAVISVPFVVFNQPAYLTFSPSGNFIVGVGCRAVEIACGNPAIYWWSASDGTQVAEWDVPVEAVGPLRFNPDSSLLVMRTVLYDVDTGEVVHKLPINAIQTIFSADGTFIVTHGDPLTTVWTVGE